VATVLLVAPSTPTERIASVCARSRGFVYAVGRMGVTGEQAVLADSARQVAGRVTSATDLPVCVGIGVSNPTRLWKCAQLLTGWWSAPPGQATAGRGRTEGAATFIGSIRRALDGH